MTNHWRISSGVYEAARWLAADEGPAGGSPQDNGEWVNVAVNVPYDVFWRHPLMGKGPD